MYFDMEYRSIYGCKSGTSIPVSGYYLILRKPECGGSISEQAIDEMTIPITVHTEFAGILQNDETEGALGYDGIPFTVEIDMCHCQMDSKDLRQYRTIRWQRRRCLFRHLLLADFSIYLQ